jgi:ornithine lipid ester-linked acyl 2-hydroxylase
VKIYSKKTLRYKVTAFLGKTCIRLLEFFIKVFSEEKIVFNKAEFDWVLEIEKNYEVIWEEYKSVSGNIQLPDICEISEEQDAVIERNYWTFFPLYAYGIPISENLLRCPQTTKLLEAIPDKTTAFFSVIKPGTHIKSHRGAYKGYLRYHLGVDIPSPYVDCGIKICDKVYHWENGKSLIFDDTYLHEAWNHSAKQRVVLYVDFIRPMPKPLVVISRWLTLLISHSPFIQNGVAKLQAHKFDKDVAILLG